MRISRRTGLLLFLAILLTALIGGVYLWHSHRTSAQKDGHSHQGEKYTCPMHPQIVQDRPGSCPICGMDLVKKVDGAGTGGSKADAEKMLGQISLSPTQMVMANVATTAVRMTPFSKEIAAVGIVQFDQARQAKVTAWVAGRIDKLFVNAVGQYVGRSRPVAEIYSPDLVSAQQEYLLALKSREQLRNSPIESISQGGEGLVASARQRLKLMGVKDEQIARLAKAGEPNIRLPIYTPLSGIVIEKIALQGQYVNVGDPLFIIADLSSVWVELEVYETDFAAIKIGQKVEITSQSYPGKTFRGTVSFIYPFLDPKTRTVKVRVQIPNRGMMLKPDMYVNGTVKAPGGNYLTVPVSAVMDTGRRRVVWVETKPGTFEPRDVQTGARSGDAIQVLSGLREGEKVASSGGYLIESEAQLRSGTGGGHAGHEGMKEQKDRKSAAPAGSGHEGHSPGAPAKNGNGMNMDDMKM